MPLLPETGRQVDEIVARVQARGRVPSVVAAVVRDGVLAHFTGAGDLPEPDPDMQYRIGSITKTLTAALVLQLRDEGRLALDDRLDQHLPGAPVGRVTLRHLLGHVSGMQREPDGDWWERSAGTDLATFLAGLTPEQARLPAAPRLPLLEPGVRAARRGAAAAHRHGVGHPGHRAPARAAGHDPHHVPGRPSRSPAGYVVHPWHGTLREEPRHDAGAMAPAGQLWSTAADLARWAAFLADPDPDLLAPATVAEMCAPVVISDLEAWTYGYGLGLELCRVGERVFAGHGGSMPGYLAHLTVHRPSPDRRGRLRQRVRPPRRGSISGLSLADPRCRAGPASRAARRAAWRPSAAPPAEIAPLCGRWWWMGREYEAALGRRAERAGDVLPGPTRQRESWRFTAGGTDRGGATPV